MSEATQSFKSFEEWVNKASSWLTRHSDYHEQNFRAICFDSVGNICRRGKDMMHARDNNLFPVYWIWPDQNLFNMIDSIPRKETENG